MMGSESVASCRQPLPASPGSPLPDKAQSVQKNSFERVTNKGACFFCNEEGHWVRDCPNRSNLTPGSGSPTAGRRNYPEMQCPCGYGACIIRTSRTVKNPGRDFYRCPGKQSEQCDFFKWCDEAASSQIPKLKSPMKPYQQQHDGINNIAKPAGHHGLKSPMKHGKQRNDTDHPNPMCSCGAGICILMTVHDGENAGRKYFACPIKKGQGACNHFQWSDSPSKAGKIELSDNLLNKPNPPILDNKQGCKAINVVEAEDTVAPLSPLLQDQRDSFLQISPVKRLSLGDASNDAGSSKHKRCLKFGGEGNWLNETSSSPNSPCFKCGKFGHSKYNCPA